MRGLGVVLAAFLLLFSLCNVLAENSGDHQASLNKRSTDDVSDNGDAWEGDPAVGDNSVQKRFDEFVGKRSLASNQRDLLEKRAPYEFVGKRASADKENEFADKRSPYEFVGKRSPYEFVGKRSPYEFVGKRSPYEFVGKRAYEFLGKRASEIPYTTLGQLIRKRRPYEFIGKRSHNKRVKVDIYGKRVTLPYEFLGKRAMGEGGSALVKDVASLVKRSASKPRSKRYSEWLGKRQQETLITPEMLRELINKRINAMILDRSHDNEEFVGRRELELLAANKAFSSLE